MASDVHITAISNMSDERMNQKGLCLTGNNMHICRGKTDHQLVTLNFPSHPTAAQPAPAPQLPSPCNDKEVTPGTLRPCSTIQVDIGTGWSILTPD